MAVGSPGQCWVLITEVSMQGDQESVQSLLRKLERRPGLKVKIWGKNTDFGMSEGKLAPSSHPSVTLLGGHLLLPLPGGRRGGHWQELPEWWPPSEALSVTHRAQLPGAGHPQQWQQCCDMAGSQAGGMLQGGLASASLKAELPLQWHPSITS